MRRAETPSFEPGTLRSRVAATTESALRSGALQSVNTEVERVEDAGIPFVVRIVSRLTRKDEEKKIRAAARGPAGGAANPFLPYDEAMFVADLSDTHVCLLNKFNVVTHHLLMVTRAFEDQESWLTRADFAAAAICLSEIDGLVFYNAGAAAGASQPHKHLQLVTLPFAEGGPRIPIETILGTAEFRGELGQIATLPFRHALSRIDGKAIGSPDRVAEVMTAAYRSLLSAVGADRTGRRRPAPYNLLCTREWMLVVPRAREQYESISVNALGFAGSLFVRDHGQLERLKRRGPVAVLSRVGLAR